MYLSWIVKALEHGCRVHGIWWFWSWMPSKAGDQFWSCPYSIICVKKYYARICVITHSLRPQLLDYLLYLDAWHVQPRILATVEKHRNRMLLQASVRKRILCFLWISKNNASLRIKSSQSRNVHFYSVLWITTPSSLFAKVALSFDCLFSLFIVYSVYFPPFLCMFYFFCKFTDPLDYFRLFVFFREFCFFQGGQIIAKFCPFCL